MIEPVSTGAKPVSGWVALAFVTDTVTTSEDAIAAFSTAAPPSKALFGLYPATFSAQSLAPSPSESISCTSTRKNLLLPLMTFRVFATPVPTQFTPMAVNAVVRAGVPWMTYCFPSSVGNVMSTAVALPTMLVILTDEPALNGFVPAAISSLFLMPSPSESESSQTWSANWALVTPYFIFHICWVTLLSITADAGAARLRRIAAAVASPQMARCKAGRREGIFMDEGRRDLKCGSCGGIYRGWISQWSLKLQIKYSPQCSGKIKIRE